MELSISAIKFRSKTNKNSQEKDSIVETQKNYNIKEQCPIYLHPLYQQKFKNSPHKINQDKNGVKLQSHRSYIYHQQTSKRNPSTDLPLRHQILKQQQKIKNSSQGLFEGKSLIATSKVIGIKTQYNWKRKSQLVIQNSKKNDEVGISSNTRPKRMSQGKIQKQKTINQNPKQKILSQKLTNLKKNIYTPQKYKVNLINLIDSNQINHSHYPQCKKITLTNLQKFYDFCLRTIQKQQKLIKIENNPQVSTYQEWISMTQSVRLSQQSRQKIQRANFKRYIEKQQNKKLTNNAINTINSIFNARITKKNQLQKNICQKIKKQQLKIQDFRVNGWQIQDQKQ